MNNLPVGYLAEFASLTVDGVRVNVELTSMEMLKSLAENTNNFGVTFYTIPKVTKSILDDRIELNTPFKLSEYNQITIPLKEIMNLLYIKYDKISCSVVGGGLFGCHGWITRSDNLIHVTKPTILEVVVALYFKVDDL